MSQNKLREKIAETFIAALKEEKIPWQAMWNTQRPVNAVTGKKYNGVNSLWLSFAADEKQYGDNRWCTFKQAQSKGWQIKKGEKASMIEYWRLYDKAQKKYIEPREARAIIDMDPDREKDIVLSCRFYYVFNAKQIEGIPALEAVSNVDIEDIRAKRDLLLTNMELQFKEGGSRAYYQPAIDCITMPPKTPSLTPMATCPPSFTKPATPPVTAAVLTAI